MFKISNDNHLSAGGFPLMPVLNRKSFNNERNRFTGNGLNNKSI